MRARLKFGGSYLILTIQSRGGKKKVFKIGFLKSRAVVNPVLPYSYYYYICSIIVIVVDSNTRFFFNFVYLNQKTLLRTCSTRQRTRGSTGNWKLSALTLGSGRTKHAWRVCGGIRHSFCAEGAQRGRWREVGSHSNMHQVLSYTTQ
jgi:hypothetical protein